MLWPFGQEVPVEEIEEIVPTGLTTGEWVQAGALAVGSLALAVLVHRLVVRAITAGSRARVGVARLVGRLTGMAVFAGGVLYALNTLGVRIGPLLGALGIVGIALAIAMQDMLENFVSGIILQARDPIRLGDQIECGDWQGTVEDINFRDLVLHTVDGTRVVLPNSSVLKDAIQNLTAFDHRRTAVTVGVAYGTDLERAAEVLRRAVGDVGDVVAVPAPDVLVEELAESSVNFAVFFWHEPQIATMWRTRDQVLRACYAALRRDGIQIPFPQRTLSFLDPLRVDATREPDTDSS
jgi:small conductance mechanosensitive channel